ncbi:MAG: hypothetical protein Fur005_00060 [Roseiflexaceae bacterium]
MTSEYWTQRQRQTAVFVAALERLDAGGRARLKRNAGRSLGEARDIHRAFFQALPHDLQSRFYEDYFLIATLFPLVPHRDGAGSIGTAMHTIRSIRGGQEKTNSLDRRFQTLLDTGRDYLPFRLRQAVRLIAADTVSIDWAEALRDVLAWEYEGRPTQLRWAEHYYLGPRETTSDQP